MAPAPTCGFAFPHQKRYGVPFHTQCSTALNGLQRRSISPGRGVCAARGGNEPVDGLGLALGADWVHVTEVVSASEVLNRPRPGQGGEQQRCGGLACFDLPVKTEVVTPLRFYDRYESIAVSNTCVGQERGRCIDV
jgi:hypothetical protein